MERQQELKVLLKRWEAEFLRERQRKPSQADIEEAPEEMRKLYKEYKLLKKQEKSSESSGKTKSQEILNVEKVEDSGFWGSHLNRAPKIPGKIQSRSPRPGISAEFYGMKLKAKLGTTGKEPPLTPRRTPNPRKIPKIPQSQKNLERGPETSPSELAEDEEKSPNPENPKEFPKLLPNFPPVPEKFQRLKQQVAQTLGSLDPGWIQRCEESPKKWEFPIKSGRENEEKGEKKPKSIGNSGRKRPREGGGAAEAPAKLRKSLQGSNPGILGMREIQEDEEERLESQNGAEEAAECSEKILEKEEKPKGRNKTRARPQNGENFVRLNLKRKTYSRGSLRGKFLRKQVWKQKWRKKFGAGADLCFRCGGKGHWASECPEKDLGSFSEKNPEEELPTLEEVAQRTNGIFIPEIPGARSTSENSQITPNSLDFPQLEFSHPSPPPPPVDPLYPPNPDGTIPDPPEEVLEALRILGYESFRPGQAEAIMRILSGISTLVVLSTGTGKSLCYQLPAFLHHRNSGSICLVISPLVSLMDDQVSGLPSALSAVCVHSNLSQSQRKAAVEKIKSGRAQIVLLSPESLVGAGAFSRLFRDFPPVAFACLDEVHCVSQWSHNFRPAYLRVCKVLRERLGVRCFLGLTATATAATARDVAQHLGIAAGKGLGEAGIPENLQLSVSRDPDRDQAVLWLLRAGPLRSVRSVLVYCGRREQSQRLAALIQQHLPEKPGENQQQGQLRVSAAYHAGLMPRQRRQIQRDFMANRIRVLCATVSFGMGLDKADLGAVVHYDLPGSIEGYVQEVGRAGRDGSAARCHLFLDTQGQDLLELRRHIHENSVDFLAIKTLIQRVFAPCKCLEKHQKTQENSEDVSELPENSRICRGHQRSIPVQELVEALDLREEGVETLLCVLELHPGHLLELFSPVHSRCRVQIPRNFPQELLRDVAKGCPPLGFVLAQRFPSGISGIPGISGALEFDAVALSDSLGWGVPRVQQSLCRGRRLGLRVEFQELAFYFRSFGDLNSRDLDSVCRFLHSRVTSREKLELRRLQRCSQTFHSVAVASCVPWPEAQVELEQNRRLRQRIREFFTEEMHEDQEEEEKKPQMEPEQEEEIRAQIRELLAAYPDEKFSGRAVARIFQGIGSPRFPAQIFGRDRRFWRRLLGLEFRTLARVAAQEILAWR